MAGPDSRWLGMTKRRHHCHMVAMTSNEQQVVNSGFHLVISIQSYVSFSLHRWQRNIPADEVEDDDHVISSLPRNSDPDIRPCTLGRDRNYTKRSRPQFFGELGSLSDLWRCPLLSRGLKLCPDSA